jgi:hypothetical protein
MESKTYNVYPVMEDSLQTIVKFVQLFNFFCAKGFNSGPPARTNNFDLF